MSAPSSERKGIVVAEYAPISREPAADEVLVRVFATSSNPKDWKVTPSQSLTLTDIS